MLLQQLHLREKSVYNDLELLFTNSNYIVDKDRNSHNS